MFDKKDAEILEIAQKQLAGLSESISQFDNRIIEMRLRLTTSPRAIVRTCQQQEKNSKLLEELREKRSLQQTAVGEFSKNLSMHQETAEIVLEDENHSDIKALSLDEKRYWPEKNTSFHTQFGWLNIKYISTCKNFQENDSAEVKINLLLEGIRYYSGFLAVFDKDEEIIRYAKKLLAEKDFIRQRILDTQKLCKQSQLEKARLRLDWEHIGCQLLGIEIEWQEALSIKLKQHEEVLKKLTLEEMEDVDPYSELQRVEEEARRLRLMLEEEERLLRLMQEEGERCRREEESGGRERFNPENLWRSFGLHENAEHLITRSNLFTLSNQLHDLFSEFQSVVSSLRSAVYTTHDLFYDLDYFQSLCSEQVKTLQGEISTKIAAHAEQAVADLMLHIENLVVNFEKYTQALAKSSPITELPAELGLPFPSVVLAGVDWDNFADNFIVTKVKALEYYANAVESSLLDSIKKYFDMKSKYLALETERLTSIRLLLANPIIKKSEYFSWLEGICETLTKVVAAAEKTTPIQVAQVLSINKDIAKDFAVVPAVADKKEPMPDSTRLANHRAQQELVDNAWRQLLIKLAQAFPVQARKVFISYAWYPDSQANQILQNRLSQLRDDLQVLGFNIFLDVSHMSGDMSDTMRQNIQSSDFILFIGTPRFKERAEDTATNLAFELNTVLKEVKRRKENQLEPLHVLPLMFEGGSFREVFPVGLFSYLLRDFSDPNKLI